MYHLKCELNLLTLHWIQPYPEHRNHQIDEAQSSYQHIKFGRRDWLNQF